jgi:hypothetical protein
MASHAGMAKLRTAVSICRVSPDASKGRLHSIKLAMPQALSVQSAAAIANTNQISGFMDKSFVDRKGINQWHIALGLARNPAVKGGG